MTTSTRLQTLGLSLLAVVLTAAVAAAEPVGDVGGIPVERLHGGSRVETAVAISQQVFGTAPAAVLARADDYADALVGAPLAAALGGPILLTASEALPPAVADELDRLGAEDVVLLGGVSAIGEAVEEDLEDRGYRVRRIAGDSRYATAAAVAEDLAPADAVFVATGENFPDALAAGPYAAVTGRPILLVSQTAVPRATAGAVAELDPSEVIVLGGESAVTEEVLRDLDADARTVRRLSGADRFATAVAVYNESLVVGLDPADLWLATAADFPDALAAGPAVAAAGGSLLLVDGTDLTRSGTAAERVAQQRDTLARIRLLGGPAAINGDAVDQLDAILLGATLPRGGRSIFPEFRLVGFYGGPFIPALGVLGEGSPDEAGQRLLAQAAPYDTDERPIIPVFELIVVVAQRHAGSDGLYRHRVPHEHVQAYLDAVRRIDGLLLMDLQPGRSDFPTEARVYEQFLVQPDVGLALDPEWRMGPNEVPGETIGSVDAAEVNAVSDYLADLVATHHLPEKLFVVHQFRHDMITNRDQITNRDGLATTIHVDGFGSRAQKLDTYGALAVSDGRWANGFKLFYDEDTNLFQPHEVLELSPVPDLITYQ